MLRGELTAAPGITWGITFKLIKNKRGCSQAGGETQTRIVPKALLPNSLIAPSSHRASRPTHRHDARRHHAVHPVRHLVHGVPMHAVRHPSRRRRRGFRPLRAAASILPLTRLGSRAAAASGSAGSCRRRRRAAGGAHGPSCCCRRRSCCPLRPPAAGAALPRLPRGVGRAAGGAPAAASARRPSPGPGPGPAAGWVVDASGHVAHTRGTRRALSSCRVLLLLLLLLLVVVRVLVRVRVQVLLGVAVAAAAAATGTAALAAAALAAGAVAAVVTLAIAALAAAAAASTAAGRGVARLPSSARTRAGGPAAGLAACGVCRCLLAGATRTAGG